MVIYLYNQIFVRDGFIGFKKQMNGKRGKGNNRKR